MTRDRDQEGLRTSVGDRHGSGGDGVSVDVWQGKDASTAMLWSGYKRVPLR